MKYNIVLVDPPWKYRAWKGNKGCRTADSFYPTMSLIDLALLPVRELADSNAALFLWTTAPLLDSALTLMALWEFEFKTAAFVWVKTNKKGGAFKGLGHYTRGNAEFVLLGLRGKLARVDKGVGSAILLPRSRHSEKPEEVYRRIEALYGEDMRRIELFARKERKGWKSVGNEIDGLPMAQALRELIDDGPV